MAEALLDVLPVESDAHAEQEYLLVLADEGLERVEFFAGGIVVLEFDGLLVALDDDGLVVGSGVANFTLQLFLTGLVVLDVIQDVLEFDDVGRELVGLLELIDEVARVEVATGPQQEVGVGELLEQGGSRTFGRGLRDGDFFGVRDLGLDVGGLLVGARGRGGGEFDGVAVGVEETREEVDATALGGPQLQQHAVRPLLQAHAEFVAVEHRGALLVLAVDEGIVDVHLGRTGEREREGVLAVGGDVDEGLREG